MHSGLVQTYAEFREEAPSSGPLLVSQTLDKLCTAVGFSKYATTLQFLEFVAEREKMAFTWTEEDILVEFFTPRVNAQPINLSFLEKCLKSGFDEKIISEFLAAVPWIIGLYVSVPEILSSFIAAHNPNFKPTNPCPYKRGHAAQGPSSVIGSIARGQLSAGDYVNQMEKIWLADVGEDALCDPGVALYYHGTTTTASYAIWEGGIDVEKCQCPHSFGIAPAFYITTSFRSAVRYALCKAITSRNQVAEGAAVIRFTVSESLWDTFKSVRLDPADNVPQAEWEAKMRDPTILSSTALYDEVVFRSRHPDGDTNAAWLYQVPPADAVIPLAVTYVKGPDHTSTEDTIIAVRDSTLADLLHQTRDRHQIMYNTYFPPV